MFTSRMLGVYGERNSKKFDEIRTQTTASQKQLRISEKPIASSQSYTADIITAKE